MGGTPTSAHQLAATALGRLPVIRSPRGPSRPYQVLPAAFPGPLVVPRGHSWSSRCPSRSFLVLSLSLAVIPGPQSCSPRSAPVLSLSLAVIPGPDSCSPRSPLVIACRTTRYLQALVRRSARSSPAIPQRSPRLFRLSHVAPRAFSRLSSSACGFFPVITRRSTPSVPAPCPTRLSHVIQPAHFVRLQVATNFLRRSAVTRVGSFDIPSRIGVPPPWCKAPVGATSGGDLRTASTGSPGPSGAAGS